MRILGFHHLAIQVRDLERCATFYREILGLSELTRHFGPDGAPRSVWLSLGAGQGFLALERADGELLQRPFKDPQLGLHLLAFTIPRADRAAALERLRAHDVAIEHQTRWTLYLRDPEGNRLGLSHHPEDPLPGAG